MKKKEHQFCFHRYKYGSDWTVDFWDITELADEEWKEDTKFLEYALKLAKNRYLGDLKLSEGYDFAQKEIKKTVKDQYNHYNSKLKELTKPKLDRRGRTETVIKLEAKVELLRELKNKLCG